MWELEPTDQYDRDFKKYQKKHENELLAVLENLEQYLDVLKEGVNPAQAFAMLGFLHREGIGIVAIDQKGGATRRKSTDLPKKKRRSLQQTRLYIYPEINRKLLHLLAIGNKNSQHSDVQHCKKFVRKNLGQQGKDSDG